MIDLPQALWLLLDPTISECRFDIIGLCVACQDG
jgi:hypothetical protein